MFKVNENYGKLSENYLFSEIARRVNRYKSLHPDAEVISLGIGDVTQPLCPSVVEAMQRAAAEMGDRETFRGYAPECGYSFLTEKIIACDYASRGIVLSGDEVFVNDGAKGALGHFCDILSPRNVVAVSDPVYPVYVDTTVMDSDAGEWLGNGKWSNIVYLPCSVADGFSPGLPDRRPDVIYICSPNNPTGSVLNRRQLEMWVDYARRNQSLILFDGAYEAFVCDPDIPRSIYEIEGAREVAVEFRSFSKTAGFTGLRCGYTVVPRSLRGGCENGTEVSLNALWRRHQSTKFNGTAYIVQRAAEAVYTPQGQAETRQAIAYYMNNARLIVDGLCRAGFRVYGGENAPYIWGATPDGMDSWAFFDRLLGECQIISTPGVGFGPSGEGYFRMTAFAGHESVLKAMERIRKWKITPKT